MAADAAFSWPLRVYIEDTDAGGIVFYANYLKYMERARTEWARSCGVQVRGEIQNGINFVVHSLNVRYHRSARLDDELVATAAVIALGRTWLLFQQRVERSVDGELLCEAEVKVACVGLESGRPCRLPATMQSAAEKIMV
ncbi:tol-pal system-associated acyl-CoA thioesterase [Mangrovitalea sediminis]|uniref:tol-pal system-associated acyl-CoA thioesterase n=1 Tax=Mangrovitalea sediminis TaxID=1982043 RepID=UPI000BE55126|nr:tol-pal system-associated acyl-CoA thioesterase [Mangrovitalea sediminis]